MAKREEIELNDKEIKEELKEIGELLKEKCNPDWCKEAFMQYSGLKKGKMLTKKEFLEKFREFERSYLGASK